MQHPARRYFVEGRVQGVGYRWFALHAARQSGVEGWVRNLADGSVEVFAMAKDAASLDRFAALLARGPDRSEVTNVVQRDAAPESLSGFRIL